MERHPEASLLSRAESSPATSPDAATATATGAARPASRSLNVGCGKDIRPAAEGWTNMDLAPLEGVDVVHDILSFPWPFEDATFDHALLSHVMEHIPHQVGHPSRKDGMVLVMEELFRILKPGGTVEIRGPHWESDDRWADPTHTRVVHLRNFQYFDPDTRWDYYSTARFKIDWKHEVYQAGRPDFLRIKGLSILEHLAIRFPRLRPRVYTVPRELHVRLRKV